MCFGILNICQGDRHRNRQNRHFHCQCGYHYVLVAHMWNRTAVVCDVVGQLPQQDRSGSGLQPWMLWKRDRSYAELSLPLGGSIERNRRVCSDKSTTVHRRRVALPKAPVYPCA